MPRQYRERLAMVNTGRRRGRIQAARKTALRARVQRPVALGRCRLPSDAPYAAGDAVE